jgi:hypothetical protein
LYKRASRLNSSKADLSGQYENASKYHGIVLAELVVYIEDVRSNQTIAPVLKLFELNKLYVTRLNRLGIVTNSQEHSSRLKERIIGYIPSYPMRRIIHNDVQLCCT